MKNDNLKNQEQCAIPVVMCSATAKIKDWLLVDDSRIWKQQDNPNCFISNRCEALYVYENKIKFWEDIRNQSFVLEHRIPESKTELYDYILNDQRSLTDETIENTPQLPQVQYDLQRQLRELRVMANKLGLYDAADFLRSYCG